MNTILLPHKIILGLLTVCLFSFVAIPLQSWDYGLYANFNSAVLTYWGMASLLAIIVAFYSNNSIPMPIIWGIFSIIVSIVLLPFLDFPLSSIIGLPTGNFGIVQNLSGVIIAYATYSVCRDNPKNQAILVVATVLALITFTAIGIFYGKQGVAFEKAIQGNVFAPFGDIYAFIAMPSLVIVAVGLYNPHKTIKYISVLGVFVTAFNIFISDSQSAQLLLLSTPFLYGFLYMLDKYGKKFIAIKPYLIPLTIMALTTIITLLILWIEKFVNHNNSLGVWGTLMERSLMAQVFITTIMQEPATLLTGWGWGQNHYIQQLYSPLTSSFYETDVRVYGSGDPRAVNAGALGAKSFHNVLIDITAAIGIFGGIAFLAMLTALGKMCRNHNFVLISWIILMGLYSIWFPVAVTIIPFFVAIGMTCTLIPITEQTECKHMNAVHTPVVQKIVNVSVALFIIGGAFYYTKQVLILSKSYKNKIIAPELYDDTIYNQDAVNYSQGRHALRVLIAPSINSLLKGKSITENQSRLLIDGLNAYIKKSENDSLLLTLELLHVINIIMVQGDEKHMGKAREKYFPLWVPTLKKAIKMAPYRFDLWRPYFHFLTQYKQYQQMGNMAQYILENGNPNDPTALFYRGFAFRSLGDEQSAQKDIQRAIDYGISSITFNAKEFLKP